MAARSDILETFLTDGSLKAAEQAVAAGGESVDVELRRRRLGLAMAAALGDLSGELDLETVTGLLSDFADGAIDRAIAAALIERCPDDEPRGVTAIALGKLGSRELNFSSDVDLILLFDPRTMPCAGRDDPGQAAVRIGRRVVEILQKRTADGYVARVDLRLRPSPEVTPIVLPVNAAISYYESAAVGWERAAFIRARCCGGDRALGASFLDAIEPFVWRRALDFGAIEEVRAIGERIRDHYAERQRFGPGFDLKRGRGGIREVEFYAHAQQLVHGGREPDLRCPATLDALQALSGAGYLDSSLAADMAEAYRRLRTIEHRVQMIDDQQTHLIPRTDAAVATVARLHGFEDGEEIFNWLRPSVERVGTAFDALTDDKGERLPNDAATLHGELAAMGFPDAETAARRIGEWRSGRPRSLRSPAAKEAFEGMLPGLVRAIAGSADPMRALNRLSDVVERLPSGVNLYRLLEARPALTTLLARILAHAPALSDQLGRRPELLDSLLDSSCFDPPPPVDELLAFLKAEMKDLPYDLALDRARQLVNERRFALGAQLIDLREPPMRIGEGYARVAEATLVALTDAAVAEFEQTHGRMGDAELLILGLGRLGGGVLTDASDLDLIYLFTPTEAEASDGRRPLGPADYFNRLGNRISAALSVPTPAGPLYDVDTRLRPQGAQGMLVVSLEGFAAYQANQAWTWEHMALLRARPVYGSEGGRARLDAIIEQVLAAPADRPKLVADATAMRDEMARHKPASGPLDVKLGEGGLVDLEFAVHVLQLATKVGIDPRMDQAVEALAEAGLVEEKIVSAQQLLNEMLITIRLVAPETTTPSEESCELMARACGAADWTELVARHDAARAQVTELWTKVKERTFDDR
ncbi:bifunctional [glutamate--ammonia ligase]-adenylyl-L-tyrosine phosphorylase/[glutamate--ammonia-ligase] adenylyltransferase [Sphingomonas sabuli]|uniref:Bifunctional [glutamate--ammonia ligase]-adenylyl-L-tyrosine phosphorylase/[glutamate--ammonia-ligase] adenylyltransferase n=2 Tax=Sphingomonas sabuli TaxID=2764186 RepID=A0A7G9L653_9SPHN|nr:bifunctional [glutamate--ammonia ligase]-adenylyl-L-tyrosine phosphorylase/[glutamate--ammonia-ligase] adenylyltransferase [Sphingomonas sabuli]